MESLSTPSGTDSGKHCFSSKLLMLMYVKKGFVFEGFLILTANDFFLPEKTDDSELNKSVVQLTQL